MTQLPLRFPLKQQFTMSRFYIGKNAELIGHLREGGNIWMYSEDATGKTHLLQAFCQEANAVFLPADRMSDSRLDLTGYEMFPLLLIDDVDRWFGQVDLEEKFLALFEAVQQQSGRIIVATSKGSPVRQRFLLRDLASRLRSFHCFEVMPLSGVDYRSLLLEKASARGLLIDVDVVDYLLSRMNRSHRTLIDVLEKIDRESLAQHREVTIPFVRQVLELGNE